MSWGQWHHPPPPVLPQQMVPTLITSAPPPPLGAAPQFNMEQWSQFQNWNQWSQWQQQYQQWQQQYGAEYQRSVTNSTVIQPPLPPEPKPPPLPVDPPPPPPPPPTTTSSTTWSQPPPPIPQSRPEELTESEKNFDKQFAEWETQFNTWKEQNSGHPDKEQYREYEKKWEQWRIQLLERREQMRRKRLMSQKPPPTVQHYTAPPPIVTYTKPPPPTTTQAPPPIVINDFDEETTTTTLNNTSKNSIPGLDLVKDISNSHVQNVDEMESPMRVDQPDFDALSKGINSILGDQKLMSMLSMVTSNVKTMNPIEDKVEEQKEPEIVEVEPIDSEESKSITVVEEESIKNDDDNTYWEPTAENRRRPNNETTRKPPPMWSPMKILDYDHKSKQKPIEFDVLVVPLYMFDYRHKSLTRIPLPQRPKWLADTVRNIREFEPPLVGLPPPYKPPPYSNQRKRDFHTFRGGGNPKFKPLPPMEPTPPMRKLNFEAPPLHQPKTLTLVEDLLHLPGRNKRAARIVIIIRGPPGSGKTNLAKTIKDIEVENGGSAPRILSLDDYFMVEKEKDTDKEMVYEYEPDMEENYRCSLMKSFRKTITDGYFNFIIVDNVNDRIRHFAEMWSFAKQHGFEVYICQMDLNVDHCKKVHRPAPAIEQIVKYWETTPAHYQLLDVTSLVVGAASIPEVEMEEVNSPENPCESDEGGFSKSNDSKEPIKGEDQITRSKWDTFDCTVDNLAKLDGVYKPFPSRSHPSHSMEEYLQMDEWWSKKPIVPGQKRVRWADLEEEQHQKKMRAMGFVVGQTDWNRMMNPKSASAALTQTKYIERRRKRC